MADIGSRVVELRGNKSITQEKLSELSGVSITQISRIESGSANPTIESLVAICNALDTDLASLLTPPTRIATRRPGRPRKGPSQT